LLCILALRTNLADEGLLTTSFLNASLLVLCIVPLGLGIYLLQSAVRDILAQRAQMSSENKKLPAALRDESPGDPSEADPKNTAAQVAKALKSRAIFCGSAAVFLSCIFAFYFMADSDIHLSKYCEIEPLNGTQMCLPGELRNVSTPIVDLPFDYTSVSLWVIGKKLTLTDFVFGTAEDSFAGNGPILASFALTMLACLVGGLGIIAVSKEKLVSATRLFLLSLLCSLFAMVYFVEFDVMMRGVRVRGALAFTWGPGLNIAASILHLAAVVYSTLVTGIRIPRVSLTVRKKMGHIDESRGGVHSKNFLSRTVSSTFARGRLSRIPMPVMKFQRTAVQIDPKRRMTGDSCEWL